MACNYGNLTTSSSSCQVPRILFKQCLHVGGSENASIYFGPHPRIAFYAGRHHSVFRISRTESMNLTIFYRPPSTVYDSRVLDEGPTFITCGRISLEKTALGWIRLFQLLITWLMAILDQVTVVVQGRIVMPYLPCFSLPLSFPSIFSQVQQPVLRLSNSTST